MKLVFFDLDGTILGGISSENAFILHLLFKGYIGFKQFLMAFLYFIRWLPKFKWHSLTKNKAYLTGLSTKEIQTLGQRFVREQLIKNIRPVLRERIEIHRAHGDRLILLSGSLEFLAIEFAKELNIDEVHATTCAHAFGQFTNWFPTQHPYADEKLQIAKKLCIKYGVDLKDCVAYGNSINDRFLLQAVGQPVAVTPHFLLRKIAKKNNWEIIDHNR